jgi:type I restriction enzyme, S subunit
MTDGEGWRTKRLDEVVSLQRGHDLTWRDRKPGSIPVMGSAGANGTHDRAISPGPGVVIGRSGASYGQAHYVESDYWPHNTALYVTDFHGNNPRYIYNLLDFIDFSRYNSGGAQQSLNRNFIAGIVLGIPDQAEQERITAAIDDTDALITSLERLITKKRDTKQGMMQELLTGRTRLPSFSEAWSTTSLGDVSAFITKGATPTTYGFTWESTGVPFLRSECVSEHGLDMTQSMFISNAANQALRRSQISDGDILMTITGYVGRVVWLAGVGVANINQHIARVRIKDPNFDTGFVYHYLSQPIIRMYYETIVTGQAYPQISLVQVRNTEIPTPSIEEQRAIADVLTDADDELEALERRLESARAIKTGMMQELLTGRTRLPVEAAV